MRGRIWPVKRPELWGKLEFLEMRSADERMYPSPILECVESVDGRMYPLSVVQSRRNQTTILPESTDGLMYPVRGLMETSERSDECENVNGDPLVVTELNAVEEPLSTVSSVSEATIPVVPAMHAVARTGICSNFSPGWPELAGAKLAESNGKGRSTYIITAQKFGY